MSLLVSAMIATLPTTARSEDKRVVVYKGQTVPFDGQLVPPIRVMQDELAISDGEFCKQQLALKLAEGEKSECSLEKSAVTFVMGASVGMLLGLLIRTYVHLP